MWQIAVRPDLVAPGEEIAGPVPNGGYDNKTGTSMATPQVAGICALMMEWGIIKGNDPYLFGQRLKYYLVRGARRRRSDVTYPDPLWGYGEVCVFNSLSLLESDLNAILTRKYEDDIFSRITELRKDCEPQSIKMGNEFIPPIIPELDNKRKIPKFYY